MFPFLAVIATVLIGVGARLVTLHQPLGPVVLGLGLLPGAVAAAVFVKLLRHPGGVKDWRRGGVADVAPTARGVRWLNWALVVTRTGELDAAAGRVRLERRLLFGLIPVGRVDRDAGEFCRVEVTAQAVEGRREDGRPYTDHVVHSVTLVDRRAGHLCVLEVTAHAFASAPERLTGRLREAFEEIVGTPAEHAPRLGEEMRVAARRFRSRTRKRKGR